jgi:hypothetical protein
MHGSSMKSPFKEKLCRMTRVLIVIATVLIGGGIGKPIPLTADAYVAEIPK